MKVKIKIGSVANHNPGSETVVNWDEGDHDGIISQILVAHGPDGILSIQFQFLMDGELVLSDRHGWNTGSMFDVITLDCPHEYITGISGMRIRDPSSRLLKSLKFTTNVNEYGPFGYKINTSDVEKFEFNLGKLRQFGGFYGTYDVSGLKNIGVYFKPTTIKPGMSNQEEIELKNVFLSEKNNCVEDNVFELRSEANARSLYTSALRLFRRVKECYWLFIDMY